MDGTNSTISDYLNISTMNSLLNIISHMKNFSFEPQWLSETGVDWCSCSKLSATFVAGFLWLDKLGLCASNGVDKVLRQDMWGEYTGIIDHYCIPRPDYWLTFLYKKLIGRSVYNVLTDQENENLRLYTSSSKKYALFRFL